MLKGILMIAMLGASYGVVYLMYGSEGLALRQRQGKKIIGPCAGIAILLLLWMLCILLLSAGVAAGDTGLAIGVTILVPIVIIALVLSTRKKVKKALEEEKNGNH